METFPQDPQNRVLAADARRSTDFFADDPILQHLFRTRISPEGQAWMQPRWSRLGADLAGPMDQLSLTADQQGPRLRTRNLFGEALEPAEMLEFHPAYAELLAIAVRSGMFRVKWEPALRARFSGEGHRLGFSAGLLYAMGEAGLYCPLCMTDGVARILDRFGSAGDVERLLPRIYTELPEELYTGAMFLTEKSGGSDVGANRVRAERQALPGQPGDDPAAGAWYRLYGEKWFCSNAGAELALALARTEGAVPGTRGLSIFLLEPYGPDGLPNPRQMLRLKEKLGVRSMASAELLLTGTWGKRLGQEGQGFAIMAEMINLSRLYNAVTAVALARRALREAWFFLRHRKSFGRTALEHSLVRERLERLSAGWLGELLLCWRAIEALDNADAGDDHEAALARLLTPMVKRSSAAFSVYAIRECMELMGGLGYIEDGVMPKMLRDANVLPIWEGAGNIMLLDMLRALQKAAPAQGWRSVWQQMLASADAPAAWQMQSDALWEKLDALGQMDRDVAEYQSRALLERLTELTQACLLLRSRDAQSSAWVDPALAWYDRRLSGRPSGSPLPLDAVEAMLGFLSEGYS
jgi:alkylation response protein AidB-like acyl-CoA dehydrogenase